MDDFTGPPEMPRPRVGLTPPSPADEASFSLDYDADRDQWTMTLSPDLGQSVSAVLPPAIVDALAERVTAQRLLADDGLQVQVAAIEYAHMGDSATFIRKPLTYDPCETVRSLLDRALRLGQPFVQHYDGERVELQVIQETIPEVRPATGRDPFGTL